MKPKILLTGRNGQVGHELEKLLPSIGEVFSFDRERLDLAKPVDLRRTIGEIGPRIIVNAAAYTAVDRAESEEAAARAINADAPAVMAEEAKKIGALLVHYSTDYVFDGTKHSPYEEDDPPNPLGVYGTTKLEGEQAVQDSDAQHLIFRTAWVYATRGRNFLLTILRLASEREELQIVRDQIGAPTWCREIARATVAILADMVGKSSIADSAQRIGGTYHMTAGGTGSWYDFTRAILEEAGRAPADVPWLTAAMKGRPLVAKRILPITTDQYPTPARRPAYSVLSNSRLNRTFGVELPDWRQQLHSAFVEA
ncbi:MAG TPA: dTDP-4-dehydrorhamnose reductase [Candidatus Acidoferrales bacterium]|nr:dTDP-4-dehydrorhamnose reductase [Candidatus Acidoferrales bacterium]